MYSNNAKVLECLKRALPAAACRGRPSVVVRRHDVRTDKVLVRGTPALKSTQAPATALLSPSTDVCIPEWARTVPDKKT